MGPEEVNETEMTNTYTCKTESTTDCTSATRPDCKNISWQECREVPVTNCQPKSVHVPMQEKQHRKKCLLPDEGQDAAHPRLLQRPCTSATDLLRLIEGNAKGMNKRGIITDYLSIYEYLLPAIHIH